MGDGDGSPRVAVPARLDRPLRLGPFASARDASKFLAAAAAAAIVSVAVVPWAGVPIALVGAVVALWRPDGEPLDERAAALGRWLARRATGVRPGGTVRTSPETGAATVVLPDGRRAVVLRASGLPLAYLPPPDLALQFSQYRELLRSIPGGVIVSASSVPIHAGSVAPGPTEAGPAERAALDGYRELVTLLARRRSIRRVYLAVPEHGADDHALEATADLLVGRLADLGVRSERLRGRALAEAAQRLGWGSAGRAT